MLARSVSRVVTELRPGLTVVLASGILIAARRGLALLSVGWRGPHGPDAFGVRSGHKDGTGGTAIRWCDAALPHSHRPAHFDDRNALTTGMRSTPTASDKPMPLPAAAI